VQPPIACGIGLQNVPAAANPCLSLTTKPAISGRGTVSFAQAGWLSLALRIGMLILIARHFSIRVRTIFLSTSPVQRFGRQVYKLSARNRACLQVEYSSTTEVGGLHRFMTPEDQKELQHRIGLWQSEFRPLAAELLVAFSLPFSGNHSLLFSGNSGMESPKSAN
jgi:hypothetical protein